MGTRNWKPRNCNLCYFDKGWNFHLPLQVRIKVWEEDKKVSKKRQWMWYDDIMDKMQKEQLERQEKLERIEEPKYQPMKRKESRENKKDQDQEVKIMWQNYIEEDCIIYKKCKQGNQAK